MEQKLKSEILIDAIKVLDSMQFGGGEIISKVATTYETLSIISNTLRAEEQKHMKDEIGDDQAQNA